MPSPLKYHHRRQAGAVPVPSSIDGFASESVQAGANTVTGSLLADTVTNAGPAQSNVPLVPGSATIVITTTPAGSSTTSTAAPDAASSSPATTGTSSASKSSISTGAVVGTCVAAAFGLILLGMLVLWCNKRDRAIRAAHSSSRARNAEGEAERRRSRMQPWDKLGDGNDAQNGAAAMSEVKRSASDSERPPMFSNISLRSGEKSPSADDQHNYFNIAPNLLSQYHPGLAEELATGHPQQHPQQQQPAAERRFQGRVDTAKAAADSWGGETLSGQADDSFLSLKSARLSGKMTPNAGAARFTPPVTRVNSEHQWESAEVVSTPTDSGVFSQVDVHSVSEYGSDAGLIAHANYGSPFFSAQERYVAMSNPFHDAHVTPSSSRTAPPAQLPELPEPVIVRGHHQADSNSSVAMQNLLAALQLPPEPSSSSSSSSSPDSGSLARVTSLRPSVYSHASTLAYADEVIPSFPLPPNTQGSSSP